jgi:hypothetical protein
MSSDADEAASLGGGIIHVSSEYVLVSSKSTMTLKVYGFHPCPFFNFGYGKRVEIEFGVQ